MSYGFRNSRNSPDRDHKTGKTYQRSRYQFNVKYETIPVRAAWAGNKKRRTGEIAISVDPQFQMPYMSYRNLLVELAGNGIFVPKQWIFALEKTNGIWKLGEPYNLINGERKKPKCISKENAQLENIVHALHEKLPEITRHRPGNSNQNKLRRTTTRNLRMLKMYFSEEFISKINNVFYYASNTPLRVPVYNNHQNS